MADTAKRYSSSVFMVFMAAFVPHLSKAYQFNVGGRAGWVVNPPENYNHWAGRMRFQVNDTLFFKYNKGSNSVLEVNRDDYGQCNVNNPILRLDDGNSIFKFNRSGPFYFISGNRTFCDQGQKLIVVVLAIRHGHPPQTPAPPAQPPALAPSPASRAVPTPAPAPSPEPVTAPPGPSMSPISPSPVATTPSNAPTPGGLPVSPPPPSSGEASPPTPSSGSQPLTPPGSPTPPSGTNPANSSPPSNAATRPAFTPSIAIMSAVSIVFSVTFGAPIFL